MAVDAVALYFHTYPVRGGRNKSRRRPGAIAATSRGEMDVISVRSLWPGMRIEVDDGHETNDESWHVDDKAVENVYNRMVPPGKAWSPYTLMSLEYEKKARAALEQHVEKHERLASSRDEQENASASLPPGPLNYFYEPKVGDNIMLKFVDTGQLSFGNTRGVILDIHDFMYEIGNDAGRLLKWCNRDQFEVCNRVKPTIGISASGKYMHAESV